jgi:putative redox protein
MIAHSEWKGNGFFEGQSESGHTIDFDAGAEHFAGPSPMEAVLMGLCACTSVDVVSILEKKRQPLTGLRVTAAAERAADPPRVFTRIKLTYTVSGELNRKAVEDAVKLSKEKYCSVSQMLAKSVEFDYAIIYQGAESGSWEPES